MDSTGDSEPLELYLGVYKEAHRKTSEKESEERYKTASVMDGSEDVEAG